MKLAIIGSRKVILQNVAHYAAQADEIVTGGAKGVDRCVAEYAREHGIPLTEFLPQYHLYGRAAPIIRNKRIVDYADKVIAIWDGRSKGTLSVIQYAKKVNKPCEVILYQKE